MRTTILALTLLLGAAAPLRADELRVVTTLRDLADIASEVGGPEVSVRSICKGLENTHTITPRPSDLIALSKADLFVQLGLDLEVTWLPGLLQAARNEAIAPGAPGFVDVSVGWEAIEIPQSLSRAGGDLHPRGNPHFNVDPRAGRHMADRILAALVEVAPERREAFEVRHAAYVARLDEAGERWKAVGARLAGRKVVAYHKEFSYLARLYGLEIVESLEPKPGIPPTAAHLARVIERMRSEEIGVILTAPWSNSRQVESVAAKTGAQVLELPSMVGGAKGAETWIGMQEVIHRRLAEAFPEPPGEEGDR